jgi:hypothetical protein
VRFGASSSQGSAEEVAVQLSALRLQHRSSWREEEGRELLRGAGRHAAVARCGAEPDACTADLPPGQRVRPDGSHRHGGAVQQRAAQQGGLQRRCAADCQLAGAVLCPAPAVLRWQMLVKRLFQLLICPPRLLPHLPAGPRQPCAQGATLELQLQPGALTLAASHALDSSQQEALRGCVGLEVSCDPSSCSACAAASAPLPPRLFTRFSLELGSAAGASLFQVGQHCRQSFLAATPTSTSWRNSSAAPW